MDLFDVVQLRYPDESFWNPNYLQPEGPCEHMLVSTLKTVSFTIGEMMLLTCLIFAYREWLYSVVSLSGLGKLWNHFGSSLW